MGQWDDVDYRTCERCGCERHVSTMSVRGPARVWICMACSVNTDRALRKLAGMGQEAEREFRSKWANDMRDAL